MHASTKSLPMPIPGTTALTLALAITNAWAQPAAADDAFRSGHVIYVSATGPANGDGSQRHPFNTLAQVEAASQAGDTIIVVPSPASVPPLDGGIALKVNQRLIGGGQAVLMSGPPVLPGGPAVPTSAGLQSVPAITNSTNATNNGDAITLAAGVEVANIVVKGSYRGGLYGIDAVNINIHDNDISGNNTSGTVGFVVQPFYLEQYAAGVANHNMGINAGWGSILLDGSAAEGNILIANNYVHDSACSDGIDIRAMGTSTLNALIKNNLVTKLIQCSSIKTLEGMGMQATATGRLTVVMDSNSQASNGSPGANSDSLFTNLGGSGVINQTIRNNAYYNGIGGSSTNGFEFIIGDGTDEIGNVKISDSQFVTNPGDMLEEFNRGVTSTARLELENVTVQSTTISGGLPVYATPAGTASTPDNTGECLGIGSVGANDLTVLKMTDTHFSGCGNNGIEVTNNHDTDDGDGYPHTIMLDIDKSSITGSHFYNLWINNVTPLTKLSVKVQDSDLTGSQSGVAVAFDQQTTAQTVQSEIDLGGGHLGSLGNNCFGGGAIYDMDATGYAVFARHDWWGQASGPTPGKVYTASSGSIADTPLLTSAPSACAAQ